MTGSAARNGRRQMNNSQQDKHQSRHDRILKALNRFQEAAGDAATAWDADLTMQQGLNAVWMLGNVIHDFRVATGLLSRHQATGQPGEQPDDSLNAPNALISEASHCLDVARVLARIGQPAMKAAIKANLERGIGAGGDPPQDGPAVAAVHAMKDALGISDGIWRPTSGTAESRDEIVTETMFAMTSMQAAALALAERAPRPFGTTLTLIAQNFNISCGHLRESLVCSLTGNYQPGTEDLARQVRAAYPPFSETGEAELTAAGTPGTRAASFAATCFPCRPAMPPPSPLTPPFPQMATASPSDRPANSPVRQGGSHDGSVWR
jgi:hypothetical protein